MSSNAECNRWGRKNGSAIIGGSGNRSGSAVSFVNTALGEVGYKESGKDINKRTVENLLKPGPSTVLPGRESSI